MISFNLLYKDFFKFLRKIEQEDPWSAYQKYYLNPHKYFFEPFWQKFPLSLGQIKERVYLVKKQDYLYLKSLISQYDLLKMCKDTLIKCEEIFPSPYKVKIYFIIGFFSPDGFVIKIKNTPVIGFGLERFKDFNKFPVLFAHEYAHYLQQIFLNTGYSLGEILFSEGKSVIFTQKVFPNLPFPSTIFTSNSKFNYYQEKEKEYWGKIIPIIEKQREEINLPATLKYYLGFFLVKNILQKFPNLSFKELIKTSWNDLPEKLREGILKNLAK